MRSLVFGKHYLSKVLSIAVAGTLLFQPLPGASPLFAVEPAQQPIVGATNPPPPGNRPQENRDGSSGVPEDVVTDSPGGGGGGSAGQPNPLIRVTASPQSPIQATTLCIDVDGNPYEVGDQGDGSPQGSEVPPRRRVEDREGADESAQIGQPPSPQPAPSPAAPVPPVGGSIRSPQPLPPQASAVPAGTLPSPQIPVRPVTIPGRRVTQPIPEILRGCRAVQGAAATTVGASQRLPERLLVLFGLGPSNREDQLRLIDRMFSEQANRLPAQRRTREDIENEVLGRGEYVRTPSGPTARQGEGQAAPEAANLLATSQDPAQRWEIAQAVGRMITNSFGDEIAEQSVLLPPPGTTGQNRVVAPGTGADWRTRHLPNMSTEVANMIYVLTRPSPNLASVDVRVSGGQIIVTRRQRNGCETTYRLHYAEYTRGSAATGTYVPGEMALEAAPPAITCRTGNQVRTTPPAADVLPPYRFRGGLVATPLPPAVTETSRGIFTGGSRTTVYSQRWNRIQCGELIPEGPPQRLAEVTRPTAESWAGAAWSNTVGWPLRRWQAGWEWVTGGFPHLFGLATGNPNPSLAATNCMRLGSLLGFNPQDVRNWLNPDQQFAMDQMVREDRERDYRATLPPPEAQGSHNGVALDEMLSAPPTEDEMRRSMDQSVFQRMAQDLNDEALRADEQGDTTGVVLNSAASISAQASGALIESLPLVGVFSVANLTSRALLATRFATAGRILGYGEAAAGIGMTGQGLISIGGSVVDAIEAWQNNDITRFNQAMSNIGVNLVVVSAVVNILRNLGNWLRTPSEAPPAQQAPQAPPQTETAPAVTPGSVPVQRITLGENPQTVALPGSGASIIINPGAGGSLPITPPGGQLRMGPPRNPARIVRDSNGQLILHTSDGLVRPLRHGETVTEPGLTVDANGVFTNVPIRITVTGDPANPVVSFQTGSPTGGAAAVQPIQIVVPTPPSGGSGVQAATPGATAYFTDPLRPDFGRDPSLGQGNSGSAIFGGSPQAPLVQMPSGGGGSAVPVQAPQGGVYTGSSSPTIPPVIGPSGGPPTMRRPTGSGQSTQIIPPEVVPGGSQVAPIQQPAGQGNTLPPGGQLPPVGSQVGGGGSSASHSGSASGTPIQPPAGGSSVNLGQLAPSPGESGTTLNLPGQSSQSGSGSSAGGSGSGSSIHLSRYPGYGSPRGVTEPPPSQILWRPANEGAPRLEPNRPIQSVSEVNLNQLPSGTIVQFHLAQYGFGQTYYTLRIGENGRVQVWLSGNPGALEGNVQQLSTFNFRNLANHEPGVIRGNEGIQMPYFSYEGGMAHPVTAETLAAGWVDSPTQIRIQLPTPTTSGGGAGRVTGGAGQAVDQASRSVVESNLNLLQGGRRADGYPGFGDVANLESVGGNVEGGVAVNMAVEPQSGRIEQIGNIQDLSPRVRDQLQRGMLREVRIVEEMSVRQGEDGRYFLRRRINLDRSIGLDQLSETARRNLTEALNRYDEMAPQSGQVRER